MRIVCGINWDVCIGILQQAGETGSAMVTTVRILTSWRLHELIQTYRLGHCDLHLRGRNVGDIRI
jgi:hypothetical protein